MVDTDLYWLSLMRRPDPDGTRLIEARSVVGDVQVGQSRTVPVVDRNNTKYALKPIRAGDPGCQRRMIADSLTGHIGVLIGAPVAPPALMTVSEELIAVSPNELGDCRPGVCHATQWLDSVRWGRTPLHISEGDNPRRFVMLAILYGLVGADDHQYCYSRSLPRLVTSYDHGNFLPMDRLPLTDSLLPPHKTWSVSTLKERSDAGALPDDIIARKAQCSPIALRIEIEALGESLSDADIARCVARIPDEWGISERERLALCSYLKQNRISMLEAAALGRFA